MIRSLAGFVESIRAYPFANAIDGTVGGVARRIGLSGAGLRFVAAVKQWAAAASGGKVEEAAFDEGRMKGNLALRTGCFESAAVSGWRDVYDVNPFDGFDVLPP
ncbi:hypothetical protein [Candidatus Filomicrobium marinum]|uniref:hypothetical protein n=1 Tax=Candidatus Filomicrobium marinum TaxID=1608628 RepID=UPI0012601174|nr:hypothetical protein [Candidatus Filomicrobium marinum]